MTQVSYLNITITLSYLFQGRFRVCLEPIYVVKFKIFFTENIICKNKN